MGGNEEQTNPEHDAILQQRLEEYSQAINGGDHPKAESLLMEIFQSFMLQAATQEPSQADLWGDMAEQCAECGNWAGAQQAQEKVLELALQEDNPLLSVKPRLDLAAFLEINGKPEEAGREVAAALSTVQGSDLPPLLVMVLEAKARLELASQNPEKATETMRQALQALPDERLYDLQRARALASLAQCVALAGDCEETLQLLDQARTLALPYGTSAGMGGLHSFHARVAEVQALVHARRGETGPAVDAYARAIQHMRTICEQPHLASGRARYRLAHAFGRYAAYLDAAGRVEEAERAREQGSALLPK